MSVRKTTSLAVAMVVLASAAMSQAGVFTDAMPGGVEMEFVRIPAGSFTMGSPGREPSGGPDARPQHNVVISEGFYLGRFEITQEQWQAVMGTTPWKDRDYVQSNRDHPAVYISLHDVRAFIDRLNERVGLELYRLPTEAEWEYACRAGTDTPWSFGEDVTLLTDYAWYRANAWDAGWRSAQQVGAKMANGFGLYDIHGNVWEWCDDWYDPKYYANSPATDPNGPATGNSCVIRGGSFDTGPFRGEDFPDQPVARSADRGRAVPEARRASIGARLVRMLPDVTMTPTVGWGALKGLSGKEGVR